MTDRVNALTVVLQEDIRTDDLDPILVALSQIKGVQEVQTHVASLEDLIAYSRAHADIGQRLWETMRDVKRTPR